MTVLGALSAIVLAKYGGGLARSYEPTEKCLGWTFLLAGLGLAYALGTWA